MRVRVPLAALLLAALLAWPLPAHGGGSHGTITAGEVDMHGWLHAYGCHLLWAWRWTLTLLEAQPLDAVSLTVQARDRPLGAAVVTASSPTASLDGWGDVCLLQAQVAGLTVVGERAYVLDLTLSALPDA